LRTKMELCYEPKCTTRFPPKRNNPSTTFWHCSKNLAVAVPGTAAGWAGVMAGSLPTVAIAGTTGAVAVVNGGMVTLGLLTSPNAPLDKRQAHQEVSQQSDSDALYAKLLSLYTDGIRRDLAVIDKPYLENKLIKKFSNESSFMHKVKAVGTQSYRDAKWVGLHIQWQQERVRYYSGLFNEASKLEDVIRDRCDHPERYEAGSPSNEH
jgi:hypothetical protein